MSINRKRLFMSWAFGLTLTAQTLISNNGSSPVINHKVVTEDDFKRQEVQAMFTRGLPLRAGAVQLHRMGDEAAVILMKVLGSTQSSAALTDAQTRTVLALLTAAFEPPNAITNRSNVEPSATRFLLNMIDESTQDAELKSQISQVRSLTSNSVTRLSKSE
jgi:hypothetical protein